MHAALLIHLCPPSLYLFTPQLVTVCEACKGFQANEISLSSSELTRIYNPWAQLDVFMCQNCAATAHNDGLFVVNKLYDGKEPPSIDRKAITLTGDTSTASKAERHFDETVFPSLGGDINKECSSGTTRIVVDCPHCVSSWFPLLHKWWDHRY